MANSDEDKFLTEGRIVIHAAAYDLILDCTQKGQFDQHSPLWKHGANLYIEPRKHLPEDVEAPSSQQLAEVMRWACGQLAAIGPGYKVEAPSGSAVSKVMLPKTENARQIYQDVSRILKLAIQITEDDPARKRFIEGPDQQGIFTASVGSGILRVDCSQYTTKGFGIAVIELLQRPGTAESRVESNQQLKQLLKGVLDRLGTKEYKASALGLVTNGADAEFTIPPGTDLNTLYNDLQEACDAVNRSRSRRTGLGGDSYPSM